MIMKFDPDWQKDSKKTIESALARAGFTGLTLSKAGGIWYLIGDQGVQNHHIERCLHVVRLDRHAMKAAMDKAIEITLKEIP